GPQLAIHPAFLDAKPRRQERAFAPDRGVEPIAHAAPEFERAGRELDAVERVLFEAPQLETCPPQPHGLPLAAQLVQRGRVALGLHVLGVSLRPWGPRSSPRPAMIGRRVLAPLTIRDDGIELVIRPDRDPPGRDRALHAAHRSRQSARPTMRGVGGPTQAGPASGAGSPPGSRRSWTPSPRSSPTATSGAAVLSGHQSMSSRSR